MTSIRTVRDIHLADDFVGAPSAADGLEWDTTVRGGQGGFVAARLARQQHLRSLVFDHTFDPGAVAANPFAGGDMKADGIPWYEAFGTLMLCPSGKLLYVYRRALHHNTAGDYGVLEQRSSLDGGYTWTPPFSLFPSTATVAAGNYPTGAPGALVLSETNVDLRVSNGGGVASDGRLVVFYGRATPGTGPTLGISYITSDDEGDTWSSPTAINIGASTAALPHGRMCAIGDGLLMQTWYSQGVAGVTASVVTALFSSDNGLTWGGPVTVISSLGSVFTESSFVYLGHSTILGLARAEMASTDRIGGVNPGSTFTQVLSTDNGQTWTNQGLTTFSSTAVPSPPTLATYRAASGERYVVCYFTVRDSVARQLIRGRQSDLISGPSGWNVNTLRQIGLVDSDGGYITVIHPSGGQRAFGIYYDNGNTYFFRTAADPVILSGSDSDNNGRSGLGIDSYPFNRLTVITPTTHDPLAEVMLTPASTGRKALVLQALQGQAGDLLELQGAYGQYRLRWNVAASENSLGLRNQTVVGAALATTVATPPAPTTTGTTLVLSAGGGALCPATPFYATLAPAIAAAAPANAEIVQVTNVTGDTLTIVRKQQGSTAQAVAVGWQIAINTGQTTSVLRVIDSPGLNNLFTIGGGDHIIKLAWQQGSQIFEQDTSYTALSRLIIAPNGDRLDLLNEAQSHVMAQLSDALWGFNLAGSRVITLQDVGDGKPTVKIQTQSDIARVTLGLQRIAGQTGDILQFLQSDGTTLLANFDRNGQLYIGGQAVVLNNDSRLSDSRAPTGAAGGDLADTFPSPTIGAGKVTYAKLDSSAYSDAEVKAIAQGFLAEAYTRFQSGITTSATTIANGTGTAYYIPIKLRAGMVISNIYIDMRTVGAVIALARAGIFGDGTANNYVCQALTGDVHAQVNTGASTGLVAMALASPSATWTVPLTAMYIIGFIAVGGAGPTGVTIVRTNSIDMGASKAGHTRMGGSSTGQSDLPAVGASPGLSTSTIAIWAAVD